jgi:hypothetical protein
MKTSLAEMSRIAQERATEDKIKRIAHQVQDILATEPILNKHRLYQLINAMRLLLGSEPLIEPIR